MICYSSHFAQELQNSIESGNLQALKDSLFDQNNWFDLYFMPYDERYLLAHEIMNHLILLKDISIDDRISNIICRDSIVFLMMTIPYKPLSEHEQSYAKSIASFMNDKNAGDSSDVVKKILLAKEFTSLYFKQEKVANEINIGLYNVKNNAPQHIQDKFNKNSAFYLSYQILEYDYKQHLSFLMSINRSHNIAINKKNFEATDNNSAIEWALHEARHYVQNLRSSQPIYEQYKSGVNSRVIKNEDFIPYIILMEERQAYAFEGWIQDARKHNKLRSELQVTCDLLLEKYSMTANVIDPIYDFNDFASQRRAELSHGAIYSPYKNQPHVA